MRFRWPLNRKQLFTMVTGLAYPAILGTLGYEALTKSIEIFNWQFLIVVLFLIHYCLDFLWTSISYVEEKYSGLQSLLDCGVIATLLVTGRVILQSDPNYATVLFGMTFCKLLNNFWELTGQEFVDRQALKCHRFFVAVYGLGWLVSWFKPELAPPWLATTLFIDVLGFLGWRSVMEDGSSH